MLQRGRRCGYVAAYAVNAMCDAGSSWLTVDLDRAADDQCLIRQGNRLLQNGKKTRTAPLTSHEVLHLIHGMRETPFSEEVEVVHLDVFAELLIDLRASHGVLRKFFVVNTQVRGQYGEHWMTVAI